ncbi:MAG TPA: DNA-binding domain-containing protein [Alphaproteobacteria bacterium]|jgi:hypothetical protein|nr:DNA-binding domain-containing protein [Alphaproteobacteria bacterium]
MHALPELQMDFADSVLSGVTADRLADAIRPSPIAAADRIGIYRNHFAITLTESLGITYPVLKALVGERFFAQCARRYAQTHPPRSPVLFEYGRAFPVSLADAAGSGFAYIADVGAFEWAVNHAYHADDSLPVGASTLARIPAERHGDIVLELHASAQLVISRYPVVDIWRANQPDAAEATIDLDAGGVRVLVWRNGIDVVWQSLTQPELAFVAAVLDRSALIDACTAALTIDPTFDAGGALRNLFAGGAVAGISLPT